MHACAVSCNNRTTTSIVCCVADKVIGSTVCCIDCTTTTITVCWVLEVVHSIEGELIYIYVVCYDPHLWLKLLTPLKLNEESVSVLIASPPPILVSLLSYQWSNWFVVSLLIPRLVQHNQRSKVKSILTYSQWLCNTKPVFFTTSAASAKVVVEWVVN